MALVYVGFISCTRAIYFTKRSPMSRRVPLFCWCFPLFRGAFGRRVRGDGSQPHLAPAAHHAGRLRPAAAQGAPWEGRGFQPAGDDGGVPGEVRRVRPSQAGQEKKSGRPFLRCKASPPLRRGLVSERPALSRFGIGRCRSELQINATIRLSSFRSWIAASFLLNKNRCHGVLQVLTFCPQAGMILSAPFWLMHLGLGAEIANILAAIFALAAK